MGARLLTLLLVAILAGCAKPPQAAQVPTRNIHALLVGIDHYRFSTANQPGAAFPDLAGAVGDANRFRQAMAELYGVNVALPDKPSCAAPAGGSTMLIDACATRDRILKTLDDQIASLK